jgi:hypothetical protein
MPKKNRSVILLEDHIRDLSTTARYIQEKCSQLVRMVGRRSAISDLAAKADGLLKKVSILETKINIFDTPEGKSPEAHGPLPQKGTKRWLVVSPFSSRIMLDHDEREVFFRAGDFLCLLCRSRALGMIEGNLSSVSVETASACAYCGSLDNEKDTPGTVGL